MLIGQVIGSCTATVRHRSLAGKRLAIVQPLGARGAPEGDPQVCVDPLLAGVGQRVLINSDGRFAREVVGDDQSPVRFVVCGLADESADENLDRD
jgi:ethanolamine utilization protein EutN